MTFTYKVTSPDWISIAPVIVLVALALIIMLVDLALPHAGEKSKHTGPANFVILPGLALLGALGAIAATIVLFLVDHPLQAFNNMVSADPGTLYAYLVILTAGGLSVFFAPAYLKRLQLVHQGEYYALLLFAMTGMMLMAAALNFLIVFVGLEMFSLALYILCSFVERRKASQEAGMKYFLLSSFASAFLLYGIALTYAATGSTSLVKIASFVQNLGHAPTLLLIGMGLLSVGFAFKVSAVPFQSWTPDVYQGAPAPVTAFMSVGTKVAALLAFVRVFGFVLAPVHNEWFPVIWALAVLTMVGGNIMALVQNNVKRMLAYSSIAHGGYLLVGVAVSDPGHLGASAILFYLSCYLFMNLGAFGVVSVLEHVDNSGLSADDLRGLWYRRPLLAGLLAFFLLSLAGFPPMAGFAAKYYIFYAALQGGHPELLIIGVLASVLGIYYYLRFVATMFMEQREGAPVLATVPATPAPSVPLTPGRTAAREVTANGRREVSGPLAAGGAATALAVKAPPAKTPVAVPVESVSEQVEPGSELAWITWIGLGLAAVGTLVLGVVLPFWLANIQQAAQLLLK